MTSSLSMYLCARNDAIVDQTQQRLVEQPIRCDRAPRIDCGSPLEVRKTSARLFDDHFRGGGIPRRLADHDDRVDPAGGERRVRIEIEEAGVVVRRGDEALE